MERDGEHVQERWAEEKRRITLKVRYVRLVPVHAISIRISPVHLNQVDTEVREYVRGRE